MQSSSNPESIHTGNGLLSESDATLAVWIPAVMAAGYPWLLDAFHWAVAPSGAAVSSGDISVGAFALASLILILAFAMPLLSLTIAGRPQHSSTTTAANIRARRFALLTVAAPTIYVFFGVLSYMAGSKVPDTWIWTPAWLLFGFLASRNTAAVIRPPARGSARLRVAHGVSGALAALYVLFHIFNHLFGLISPEAHAAVMDIGRTVYRAKLVEPLLVTVMLFQIFTGLRLVWTWSETSVDRYRMFQIASGVFMSIFILGHMNSVFFYARTWLDIPTDWSFATGAPTGLIHDAWNIRLLPHYALGVFFVLAHLASGLRVVMLTHGVKPVAANRLWWVAVCLSAFISAAIMCGMTGMRLV
ncbi:hypothetical protein [Pseudomonas petrae]|uniref:Uncharacterized protein n=1 Tax=Pseudomonas petrae TaxID=2912190 RepID=A0ABS9I4R8_9PSED|nr:hypothetical protein [Pseudomonas petrae]MCF7532295.1 hypothetical protein [Pseudomonas petrae]MCF7535927.1 hypothetical protein [Pseudomonas petrae]MCF7542788.1 hypothetical protein [Pseudomonas petrae]MCF7554991.1 hypothetical protein [Pseudomonas petrae]